MQDPQAHEKFEPHWNWITSFIFTLRIWYDQEWMQSQNAMNNSTPESEKDELHLNRNRTMEIQLNVIYLFRGNNTRTNNSSRKEMRFGLKLKMSTSYTVTYLYAFWHKGHSVILQDSLWAKTIRRLWINISSYWLREINLSPIERELTRFRNHIQYWTVYGLQPTKEETEQPWGQCWKCSNW